MRNSTKSVGLVVLLIASLIAGSESHDFHPRKRLRLRESALLKSRDVHPLGQAALQLSRGGAESKKRDLGGKASIPASIFNLVNNVAGAGILTLSAGMAAGTGWLPALLTCAVLGVIGSHTFSIIGEACELTGEVDFKVRRRSRLRKCMESHICYVVVSGPMGKDDWSQDHVHGRFDCRNHVSSLCGDILRNSG